MKKREKPNYLIFIMLALVSLWGAKELFRKNADKQPYEYITLLAYDRDGVQLRSRGISGFSDRKLKVGTCQRQIHTIDLKRQQYGKLKAYASQPEISYISLQCIRYLGMNEDCLERARKGIHSNETQTAEERYDTFLRASFSGVECKMLEALGEPKVFINHTYNN